MSGLRLFRVAPKVLEAALFPHDEPGAYLARSCDAPKDAHIVDALWSMERQEMLLLLESDEWDAVPDGVPLPWEPNTTVRWPG